MNKTIEINPNITVDFDIDINYETRTEYHEVHGAMHQVTFYDELIAGMEWDRDEYNNAENKIIERYVDSLIGHDICHVL